MVFIRSVSAHLIGSGLWNFVAIRVGRDTREAAYRYHYFFTPIASDRWPRCPSSQERAARRRWR